MVCAHDVIDELLAAHQDALVDGRWADARVAFCDFRDALREHMALEQEHLLPVYTLLPQPGAGGGADLLQAEHVRIGRFVDELDALFARLDGRPGSRDIVAIIERERLLKHLLEHHGLRERTHLYPTLERFDRDGLLLKEGGLSPASPLERESHAV